MNSTPSEKLFNTPFVALQSDGADNPVAQRSKFQTLGNALCTYCSSFGSFEFGSTGACNLHARQRSLGHQGSGQAPDLGLNAALGVLAFLTCTVR